MKRRTIALAVLLPVAVALAVWMSTRPPERAAPEPPRAAASRRATGPAPPRALAPTDDEAPCPHPFFGAGEGARWVYRLRGPSPSHEQSCELAVLRSVRSEGAWTVSVRGGCGPTSVATTLECRPDTTEEPWGAASGVEQIYDGPRHTLYGDYEVARTSTATWSLPTSGPLGAPRREQRASRSLGREEVVVDAGTFDCVHVRHEETASGASEPRVIDDWLAEGVGLVRRTMSRPATAEPYATMELTEVEAAR